MSRIIALASVVQLVVGLHSDQCTKLYEEAGLSKNFNETIAHAIHSLTLNDLVVFNSEAGAENGIPVVNPRLNDPATKDRVIPHAPSESIGSDFAGDAMNVIDSVLSNIGQPTDGLGPNWSPLERIVHKFHMRDIWATIKPVYDHIKENVQLDGDMCNCLKDVQGNGIFEAVDWIARHYKSGTPITLLNRPIPKLNDATTWKVWRARLLHYYDDGALSDAAIYMVCALEH